jgi:Mucin-2 protein WxxW repeating region
MLNTTHRQRSRSRMLPLAIAAFVVFGAGTALAGTTPWFDRDNTGGVGDFELTQDLLTIKCRLKAGAGATATPVTTGSPAGYNCGVPKGAWCTNAQTVPANSCKDMEVQFSWVAGATWAAGSTPWLDRDNPGGVGDFELTQHLLQITCRYKVGGAAVTTGSPAGYNCVLPMGGWCTNAQTVVPNAPCKDIEVQFTW